MDGAEGDNPLNVPLATVLEWALLAEHGRILRYGPTVVRVRWPTGLVEDVREVLEVLA